MPRGRSSRMRLQQPRSVARGRGLRIAGRSKPSSGGSPTAPNGARSRWSLAIGTRAYLRFRRWAVRGVRDKIMAPRGGAGRAATGVRLHRRHDSAGPSKGCGCACKQIRQLSRDSIATPCPGRGAGPFERWTGHQDCRRLRRGRTACRFSSCAGSGARACAITRAVEASA